MENKSEVFRIAENIYRVGISPRLPGSLDPNIYLVISDDEAVLVNTGPYREFENVKKDIENLVPLEKIVLIVITSADADMCSALPLFENECPEAKLAMHWRSSRLISGGIWMKGFFIVNENNWEYAFKNGKQLLFFPASYLSTPGEIQVLDPESSVLFSSSLFSSFTVSEGITLNTAHLEPLAAYHEHFMPDSRIVKSIIEKLRMLPVRHIAPSRGGIISDNIPAVLKAVSGFYFGSFRDIKQRQINDQKVYRILCGDVLNRLIQIYSLDEVVSVYRGSGIAINEKTGLIDSCTSKGEALWEEFFKVPLEKKGMEWLSLIESQVRRISKEYSLSFPVAFNKVVLNIRNKNIEIDQNMARIHGTRKRMKADLEEIEERMTTCPVTGLKNEVFFRAIIAREFAIAEQKELNSTLLFISLDDIFGINSRYGREEGDGALRGVAYIIRNYISEADERSTHFVYKLNGPVFAYYIPECSDGCDMITAEKLRERIAASSVFIEDITVSIGIVNFYELYQSNLAGTEIPENLITLGLSRIQMARAGGGNTICDKGSAAENNAMPVTSVLIIEPDPGYAELLSLRLTQKGISSLILSDGNEAVEYIKKEKPSVIVSEIMVPGVNGFAIKQGLLSESSVSSIPFIIVSHKKNDEYIIKANSLNIFHYFQKPYSLIELTGIIDNILSRKSG